jgi:hypothetical protein
MTPREEYEAQVLETNKAIEQLNVALKELSYALDNVLLGRAADAGAIVPDTTPIEDINACWSCLVTEKGLSEGETLEIVEGDRYNGYECSLCSRKQATE